MFTFFRYGLIPVVLFCGVIITASIDVHWTNARRSSTWPQTVATVVQSQDLGDVAAKLRGTPNNFPDPRGTVTYVIDGQTHTWQGRGRDMGVTVMNPGDQITVHYNPKDPREINTLVLLGAFGGNIMFAGALVFLAFYFWFFWIRRFLGRSGPGGFDGNATGSAQTEPSRFMTGGQRSATNNLRPAGNTFGRGGATSFGKR